MMGWGYMGLGDKQVARTICRVRITKPNHPKLEWKKKHRGHFLQFLRKKSACREKGRAERDSRVDQQASYRGA